MNQIEQMFLLQMQLNDQTNGQVWIKGYTKENRQISWYRGIYMEVAEALTRLIGSTGKILMMSQIGII